MNATIRENNIAARPHRIGRMYGPINPRTKAMGRIAAITAKVARIVGLPTSSTASTAISEIGRPDFRKVIVADNILHHHDGIVYQYSDGEDQRQRG